MVDKKSEFGKPDLETKPVVDLLASILNEVQKQVQKQLADRPLLENTARPLEGDALLAVERFREIVAVLELRPRPTVTLTADPPQGGNVTLRWSSTNAQTLELEKEDGKGKTSLGTLTPVASGFKEFTGDGPTTFTVTAKGPCASATAFVTVTLSP